MWGVFVCSVNKGSRVRRLAFVLFQPILDTVPSAYNLVASFARAGFAVDVYTTRYSASPTAVFQDAQVQVHLLGEWSSRPSTTRRLLPLFLANVARRCYSRDYGCVVGVDPFGLIVASAVSMLRNVPVVYFSLEILVQSELRRMPVLMLVKQLERILSKRARYVIVQDKERGRLVVQQNGLVPSKILLLPNSPLGSARRRKSSYLPEKFGIASNRKVVLHAGTIDFWTMSEELARTALTWPDDWTLVFQSRFRVDESEYGKGVLQLADGVEIIVSSEPVPSSELPELVDSADVGLVLYRLTGQGLLGSNMMHVGLSSGKLAQYLQAGLPVVTTDQPSLRRLVEQYECGRVVSDLSEIESGLMDIFSRYDDYSANAIHAYETEFRFEPRFEVLLKHIIEICEH